MARGTARGFRFSGRGRASKSAPKRISRKSPGGTTNARSSANKGSGMSFR